MDISVKRTLTFIRHARPIETDLWHSSWRIDTSDCNKAIINTDEYKSFLCSGLKRSILTAKEILPMVDVHIFPELNEIEKPYESPEQFEKRVKYALDEIIMPLLSDGNVFVNSHARFMKVAAKILGAVCGRIDYLEQLHFTLEKHGLKN